MVFLYSITSRLRHLSLVFLLFSVGGILCASPRNFQKVEVKGRPYITLSSIRDVYDIEKFERSGHNIYLKQNGLNIKFINGGQEAYFNGVKFILSYPVIVNKGKYVVSALDLQKIIHPVLLPQIALAESGIFDTVIIDPGHGGIDSGAYNSLGKEKEYTLNVAHLVKRELENLNYKVVMTRESDNWLSLGERVRVANSYKNAIFISLHFNSGGGRGGVAHGIETFTLSPQGVAHYGRGLRSSDYELEPGNAQDSANIALATAVHSRCLRATRRFDRGIRRARYNVLTGVRHPAILLEGGFLSNPKEASLIHRPAYQKQLAMGIVKGICIYRAAISSRAQNPRHVRAKSPKQNSIRPTN